MDEQLIDFSDAEDEYLPPGLVKQVGAVAFGTGLVGLLLSSLLFWERGLGGTAEVLDRRGAEVGRSAVSSQAQGREGGHSSPEYHFRNAIRPAPEEPPDRDAWKRFLHLASTPIDEPEASRSPSTGKVSTRRSEPAAVSLETSPPWQAKSPKRQIVRRSAASKPASAPAPKTEIGDRLLFPVSASRPPVISEAAALDRLKNATLLLLDPEGEATGGVILSGGRLAVASLQGWSPSIRIRSAYDGRSVEARLLRADPEYGLVLLEIDRAPSDGLPLAPAHPGLGETVFCGSTVRGQLVPVPGRSGGSFGPGGFFLEGPLSLTSNGTGVLNARGELTGTVLSSIPELPGTGLHVVADSSALNRLVAGYDAGVRGRDSSQTLQRALQAWSERNARQSGDREVRRGRVLPGVGVSDLRLGMTSTEASKWVSGALKRTLPLGLTRWESPAPPLTLIFANDRLVLIASRNPGYATPTGLSLGALVDGPGLSRHADTARLYPRLAMLDGLEVWLDEDSRVREFVVREGLR